MEKFTKKDCGEPIDLRELKSHLLDMLTAFDAFCTKHQLRYYLSGGTLLGAIRHKGFIPWDDDIDVNMPRPDCEKLQALTHGKIGPYLLFPPNGKSIYPGNHWKLYDTSIVIENSMKRSSRKCIYHPAFMDIFPIDGLPESDAQTIRHYRKMKPYKKMYGCLEGSWMHGKTIASRLFHLVGRPVAWVFGRQFWVNKIQMIAKEIPFDESDYIGVMMTNIHFEEERVIKKDYMPQVDVTFENRVFKGPQDYDTYLRQLYGDDYMDMPPMEKRISHHGYTLYKKKTQN